MKRISVNDYQTHSRGQSRGNTNNQYVTTTTETRTSKQPVVTSYTGNSKTMGGYGNT